MSFSQHTPRVCCFIRSYSPSYCSLALNDTESVKTKRVSDHIYRSINLFTQSLMLPVSTIVELELFHFMTTSTIYSPLCVNVHVMGFNVACDRTRNTLDAVSYPSYDETAPAAAAVTVGLHMSCLSVSRPSHPFFSPGDLWAIPPDRSSPSSLTCCRLTLSSQCRVFPLMHMLMQMHIYTLAYTDTYALVTHTQHKC